MGILISDELCQRNWASLVTAAGEIVAQSLLGPSGYSNSLSALFRAFDHIRSDGSPEQKASSLVMETLTAAIMRCLGQIHFQKNPTEGQIKNIIESATKRAKILSKQNEIELNYEHIRTPNSLSIFDDARKHIFQNIEQFNPINQNRQSVEILFENNIVHALFQSTARKPSYYMEIIDILSADLALNDLSTRTWQNYNADLISRFEAQPLFGQEEKEPTLQDVYQPLRCWYESENNEQSAKDHEGIENVDIHIDLLNEVIFDWLNSFHHGDCIRLISGGPGSGKSTFAKYVASEIVSKQIWRVLFIPLQRLRGSGNLESRINTYFTTDRSEVFSNEVRPLSDLHRDGHRDWLFIFDGLDELAPEGPRSESAAQEFASILADFRSSIGSAARAHFIVLGRAPSMQEARRRLGLQGKGTLHVCDMLPFRPTHDHHFRTLLARVNVIDPKNISNIDQREEFWTRWARAKGVSTDVPEAILSKDLKDLTKEPLLAYLLIISGYTGENWREAADNRNRIYASIFDRIWDRERTKESRSTLNDLGQELFIALLQCLGLAAWAGGGRTGDEITFAKIQEIFIRADLQREIKDKKVGELSNVAILFYTRKDEVSGRGYEFLHKSFGEYLTATGLISAFNLWSKQLKELGADDLLRRWIIITGRSRISREIVDFIRNEAALISYKENKNRPWEYARKQLGTVAQVVDIAVEKGFPITDHQNSWSAIETEQINAECALFALLDAWARAAYPPELFGERTSKGGWNPGPVKINELKGISANRISIRHLVQSSVRRNYSLAGLFVVYDNIFFDFLSRIQLNDFDFSFISNVNIDLDGCGLSRVSLGPGKYFRCNFSRTSIEAWITDDTEFVECKFQSAKIRIHAVNAHITFTDCQLGGTSINGKYVADKSEIRLKEVRITNRKLDKE